MDWQDRRAFYDSIGKGGAQAHEDMVARRILSGLGITNADKNIYKLEERTLGFTQGDLPLWHRTKQILEIILEQNNSWILAPTPLMDVALSKSHKDALERLSTLDWRSQGVRPILFTRLHKSQICRTYTFWKPDELRNLTPPFSVLESDEHPEWYFTVQDARLFIQQLGPLEIP